MHFGKATVSIPATHKSGKLERPKLWKLEFREKKNKHFVVTSKEALDEATIFGRLGSDSNTELLIYVHGYNTKFDDALIKAAQLKFDFEFDGDVVAFSWPSSGKAWKYTHDVTSARASAKRFQKLLERLITKKSKSVRSVYVIAHSMAAECVSPAIASLGKPAGIEKLVLAAPDIDAGIFENDFLSQIIANCNETTLYGSSNDFALRASKHVNGFLRLGDSAPEISVFKEIDSIDASTIQSDFFRHGYFSTSDRLLTDIYSFLFQNLKPEQRRLKPEPSSNGLRYWRFA